jgi:RsiW-degrading membrane proteinase PrsW (M82 family)
VIYVLLLKCWPVVLPPLAFWIGVRRFSNEDFDPRPFAKFFVGGALLCLPVGLFEYYLERWIVTPNNILPEPLVKGLMIAAVPEEAARAALLGYWIGRAPAFVRPSWIISGAVALSMGQAAIESGLRALAHTNTFDRAEVLVLRAVLSVPTLGACGLAIGIATAWEHFIGKDWREGMLNGLALAIVGHAFYDCTLFALEKVASDQSASYIGVPVAAATFVIVVLPLKSRFNAMISTRRA